MKQKVKVIGRTVEAPIEGMIKNNVSFKPEDMRDEAIIFSGKASGICYMPDDYLSEGIQNEDAAKRRAINNTKSGHYSVFEHTHFNFIIETTKAMAMVLNSTKLYSTSEKSGRYTSMNPETEIEKKYYDKWINKLEVILKKELIEYNYTEKEIHKMALENARYFLSVFTPTVMEYTIPFNRVILLCEWLDKLADNINEMIEKGVISLDKKKNNYNYYKEIAKESVELAEAFRESLSLDKYNPILVDHKDIGINFYYEISEYNRTSNSFIKDNLLNNILLGSFDSLINDTYNLNDSYSFACLAQEQRHRTIDYSILEITDSFYIPTILQNEDAKEWSNDMYYIYNNSSVVCQATKVFVREQGTFDNFYLKCKERICMRAQKEIMDVTCSQILFMFKESYDNIKKGIYRELYPMNAQRLMSMILEENNKLTILPRCMWKGYTCKEPCKHACKDCISKRLI